MKQFYPEENQVISFFLKRGIYTLLVTVILTVVPTPSTWGAVNFPFQVMWNRNSESDVAYYTVYYDVYDGNPSGENSSLINSSSINVDHPVTSCTFCDRNSPDCNTLMTLPEGDGYSIEISVTATDIAGNTSGRSSPLTIGEITASDAPPPPSTRRPTTTTTTPVETTVRACDEPEKLQTYVMASNQISPFFSKDKAVDGNPSTFWSTLLSFSKKNEFITLDLGEAKKINRLTMQAAPKLFGIDFFPLDFKVEISTDSLTWTKATAEQGYTASTQSITNTDSWSLENMEGRYIRVYITRAKTLFFFYQMARIAEIAVYGCDITDSNPPLTEEDPVYVDSQAPDQTSGVFLGSQRTGDTTPSNTITTANENELHQNRAITCDNGDMCSTLEGEWDIIDTSDCYQTSSLMSEREATHTWIPDLPRAGAYALYMWWYSGINSCTSCPVDITCNGQLQDTIYVDQSQDGGQWNLLGTYNLEGANACSVTITSEGQGIKTCADAVRFEYRGSSLPEAYIDSMYPNTATMDEEICFAGFGIPGDHKGIKAYSWTSERDGEIGTTDSFCTFSLSEGIHHISFSVQDDEGLWSTPATQILTVANSVAPSEEIWLESEEGIITLPMETKRDNTASNGWSVRVPRDSGNILNATEDGGYAEYTFELMEGGDFLLWGRVKSTRAGDGSFWISMDNKDPVLWDFHPAKARWTWHLVNNRGKSSPEVFHLYEGPHTLLIKKREGGSQIDKLLITNDIHSKPTGLGE